MASSPPDPHQPTPCTASWSPDPHSWPYNWPHTLPCGLESRLAWGGNWWSWIQTLKQWDLFHSLLQKIMCNHALGCAWSRMNQCVLLVQVQITRCLNNKTSPLNSGGLWHSGQSRQWWSQSHYWDNNRTNSHVQLQHRLQPCGKQYSDLSSYRSMVWECTYLSRYVASYTTYMLGGKGWIKIWFVLFCVYNRTHAHLPVTPAQLIGPALAKMHPVQWWLCITSKPIFKGDVVCWLFMHIVTYTVWYTCAC